MQQLQLPRQFSTQQEAWEKLSKRTKDIATLLEDSKGDVLHQRRALSQAITLIESIKPSHQVESNHLLTYLLNHGNNHNRKANSFRLGIAGPPGAGELQLLVVV